MRPAVEGVDHTEKFLKFDGGSGITGDAKDKAFAGASNVIDFQYDFDFVDRTGDGKPDDAR